MRQLKYIKLFEAFDSIKLSKTLGFINKDSRKKFSDDVKKICSRSDFPLSKINDDVFEYLPFKRALEYSFDVEDVPCTATSVGIFSDKGIAGEKCEKGKIKRSWGAGRVRIVDCENCGGTGIEPRKPDLKIIKFWFNSDGEYVGKTGVDGVVRGSSANVIGKKDQYSTDIEDYIVGKELSLDEVKALTKGTPILVDFPTGQLSYDFRSKNKPVVATFYKDNNSCWGIQDELGTYDNPNGRWKQYGRYGLRLTSSQSNWNPGQQRYTKINLLTPKAPREDFDPYTVNIPIEFDRYEGFINKRYSELKPLLKNAEFALVLDLSKLKSMDVTKRSETREEREQIKKGATALLKPEDIKAANIKRYFDELVNRSKLKGDLDDLKNLNKLMLKLLGSQNILFFLVDNTQTDGLREINTIGNKIYRLIKAIEGSGEGIPGKVEDVNDDIKREISDANSYSRRVKTNLESIKTNLLEGIPSPNDIILFENVMTLNNLLYKYVSNYKIDNLFDYEILLQELYAIRHVLYSERYGLYRLRDFMGRVSSSYGNDAYRYFIRLSQTESKNANIGISNLIKFIKTKYSL
jgi:hypothetical protein